MMINIHEQTILNVENHYMNDVFTDSQWRTIETIIEDITSHPHLLENITKGYGNLEQTKVSMLIHWFIKRKNDQSEIIDSPYSHSLLSVINASSLMKKINQSMGVKLAILRMQLNVMHQDGYVTQHIDADSDKAYECSVLIRAGSEYTGGNLVIHEDQKPSYEVQQPNRSVYLMSAHHRHEVTMVKSGKRFTLCLFIGLK